MSGAIRAYAFGAKTAPSSANPTGFTAQPARRLGLAGLLFLLSLLPMAWTLTSNLGNLNHFHGDESLYIPVANKMFELYWVRHDFANPAWDDDFHTFGAINPQVGKYLMGFGSYLAGYRDMPIRPGYQFQKGLAWNVSHGYVPPAGAVAASRLPIALTGLLSCVFLYAFTSMLAGRWTGLCAMWALFLGQLLTTTSRHAMLDAPALAFSLGAMCALLCLIRAMRDRRTAAYAWAILLGVASALAVGTKLNALLIIGVAGLCLCIEAIGAWKIPPARRMVLLCTSICALSAVAIFYAVNPFLWHHPLWGLKHLLELNQVQASINIARTTGPWSKLAAVWWSIGHYGIFGPSRGWIDQTLVTLAALAAILHLCRRPRRSFDQLHYVAAVWVAVLYIITTAWLPHTWNRYFLPLAPVNALLEGLAVAFLLQMAARWCAQAAPFLRRSLQSFPHPAPLQPGPNTGRFHTPH